MKRPFDGDLVAIRAFGQFAAVLMTYLHRDKLADMHEFGDLLAIYATVTEETDPDCGLALAYVSGAIQEAASTLKPLA